LIDLLNIFANNLLPIFLAAGTGYILGKRLNVKSTTLSQIIFYIFSPCLVFSILTHNPLGKREIFFTISFVSLLNIFVGVLTWIACRLLKIERRLTAAVLMTAMFMNCGNYGLPLTLFAFGEAALAYASLYYVTAQLLVNSIGIIIASSGSTGVLQSLRGLIKFPATYSLVLAMIFVSQGWTLPPVLERTTTLLGNAAVPAMLVLLGLQLQNVRWAGNLMPASLAGMMRLVVAPAIAIGLNLVFHFPLPAYQASVIQSAMPSAVFNTLSQRNLMLNPASLRW
jgi:predicted permease